MKTTPQVLKKPLQIFLLTGVGLLAALMSDGIGDYIGWLCLACVVGAGLRYSFAGTRR